MKKLLSLLLSAVMLVTGLSASVAFAAVKPTAKDYDTMVAYLWEDEECPDAPYTFIRTKKGAIKYALDENGNKVKGWAYSYGNLRPINVEDIGEPIYKVWYYFGEDYKPLKGLQKIGKCKYFFKENGLMAQNEPVKVGKRWLWFGKNGALLKNKAGFRSIIAAYDDFNEPIYFTYYVNKIGVVLTGWRKLGGKWYYFDENGGSMATQPRKIGNTIYYFKKTGEWVKNVNGWKGVSIQGDDTIMWYYFVDGKGYTGWKKYKGNWYYLDVYGVMAHSESLNIDGVIYQFDKNGVCLNP